MMKPVTPLLTVDCATFDKSGRVLLIKRKFPPFKGCYALPGGFVDVGETVEGACRREMLEETGIAIEKLELVGVYSEPGRDPRGHTVSIAFTTLLDGGHPVAGDDAAAAGWVSGWRDIALAFDHAEILRQARQLLHQRGMIPHAE